METTLLRMCRTFSNNVDFNFGVFNNDNCKYIRETDMKQDTTECFKYESTF